MSEAREWTRAEVAGAEEPHIVIDNVVYAVRSWLDEHPGGADVLLRSAGRDATRCFVQQGHSAEARGLMRRFAAGRVTESERWPELGARLPGCADAVGASSRPEPPWQPETETAVGVSSLLAAAGPPLLLGVCATVLYTYLF